MTGLRPHRRGMRIALPLMCLVIGIVGFTALGPYQQRPAAFNFTKIADDVYFAIGTNAMTVFCNATIIINANDVLVVDTHVSPEAARALLTDLKAITTKPVRYVVNTHFHFDHSHGNQIYGPDVEIIGHNFTREMLASGASLRGVGYDRYVGVIPADIARLKAQRDTARDSTRRASLDRQIVSAERFKAQTDEVRPTPPTVAFDQSMTLYRGGREIRLHFFGRAHTGGDVFVHLPRERVLVSGDAMLASIPFMADGFFADWPETLEKIKALEFDVILPGHGGPIRDRARIDHLQAYMRDFWAKTKEQKQLGATAEQAAQRIDLRNHAANFPGIRAIGADADAVRRAYELLGR